MTVDAYVAEVLRQLPRQLIDRRTVELDLRMHLLDRMESGEEEASAVRHMGPPEETAAELMSAVPLEPASVPRRTAAFVLDIFLGLIPLGFLALLFVVLPMAAGTGMGMNEMPVMAVSFFWVCIVLLGLLGLSIAVLSVLYFPVLEALYGQTVGKRAFGIVVVRENGTSAGWMAAIVRRLPFLLEFFFIDAIFALFTKRKQRAFDKVAGTLVVKTRAVA